MFKTKGSKWSLQTRILVLTVIISASVLAATDWLATLESVRAVERAAEAQTNSTARHLGDELERLPASNFPPQFETQVREVLELEPNVIRVDAYADFDGEVKLVQSTSPSGDRDLYRQELDAFYNSQPDTLVVEEGATRHILSVHPLRFSDGRQGFVTVISSLQAVDDILATHSRIRLYSLIATMLLLVAAITLLFRTTVYRSVHHLVEVMQRFQRGESSARAEENLAGEFGELARHFNQMLEEIQRLNDDLQRGIEAATSELAARNRELQELNLQLFEAQKRLTQAERLALAGQMTATFAHEVGSPLSAVSTHLQMLLEDSQVDPNVRDRLRLANEQIDRVCSIVESLLATTRKAHRRVPVDLEEVIHKVAQFLGPTLDARQIRFEFRSPGGPCLIEGDPDQIQQVFLNLFNNSLDAIRGAGALSVDIRRVRSPENGGPVQFQIDVCDTGVGIPAEKLAHIFEPLFTTKDFGRGTGLGLAVSKWIISRHGGRISAASPPGSGACFTIVLPEISKNPSDVLESLVARELISR
ncbi:MAG: HAMP domain-containing protein [Acidobacteria bacterium]|nr:HAMP domain-containing protein [Acidobacteriota bacterium]